MPSFAVLSPPCYILVRVWLTLHMPTFLPLVVAYQIIVLGVGMVLFNWISIDQSCKIIETLAHVSTYMTLPCYQEASRRTYMHQGLSQSHNILGTLGLELSLLYPLHQWHWSPSQSINQQYFRLQNLPVLLLGLSFLPLHCSKLLHLTLVSDKGQWWGLPIHIV